MKTNLSIPIQGRNFIHLIVFIILGSITFLSCSDDDIDHIETSLNSTAKSAPLGGGIYYIKNVNSGLYLDIQYGSTSTGANVLQNTMSETASQQWELVSTGQAGLVNIKNVNSGKFLSVSSRSTANGGNIIQWTLGNNSPSQLWSFEDRGNNQYSITNKNSLKSLDVKERSTAAGANVQQWTYVGGTNQKWEFEAIGIVPCDFDLSTIAENSTVIINCSYNLQENTVTIPSGVTLSFQQGGSITNGTLVGDNLSIDGRLLNKSLKIEGEASLIDTHYIYQKEAWEITEGIISKETALQNRKNINATIELVKRLGATTFDIDKLDAYFDVSGVTKLNPKAFAEFSIRIPSNFHLQMSDNTYLRIYPSNGWSDQLLYSGQSENIKISGGHLIGDRMEHDYSAVNDELGVFRGQHEYGSLIYFGGVVNGIIDNVSMSNHPGDCILVQSSAIRNADGSPKQGETYTKNIEIVNCILDGARRNNISLTDCEDVLIENNKILNTGLVTPENPDANGTEPRTSIDLEAYREVRTLADGTRVLDEYEIVKDIIIRENDFIDNFKGLNLFTCSNVLIENNNFDDSVNMIVAKNVTINNNDFERKTDSKLDPRLNRAVYFTSKFRNGINLNTNNTFSNNRVKNYDLGMGIGGKDTKVFNNTIENCKTGFAFANRDSQDIEISGNTIISSNTESVGYSALIGEIKNISIMNENIQVLNRNISFGNINKNAETDIAYITFDNCNFGVKENGEKVPIVFSGSNNITIKNSTNVEVIEYFTTSNIVLENNN